MRTVAALLFESMLYDLRNPDRDHADVISYAAGHKALGLYSMLALPVIWYATANSSGRYDSGLPTLPIPSTDAMRRPSLTLPRSSL